MKKLITLFSFLFVLLFVSDTDAYAKEIYTKEMSPYRLETFKTINGAKVLNVNAISYNTKQIDNYSICYNSYSKSRAKYDFSVDLEGGKTIYYKIKLVKDTHIKKVIENDKFIVLRLNKKASGKLLYVNIPEKIAWDTHPFVIKIPESAKVLVLDRNEFTIYHHDFNYEFVEPKDLKMAPLFDRLYSDSVLENIRLSRNKKGLITAITGKLCIDKTGLTDEKLDYMLDDIEIKVFSKRDSLFINVKVKKYIWKPIILKGKKLQTDTILIKFNQKFYGEHAYVLYYKAYKNEEN